MQSIIIAATTQYPLGGTDPGAGSLITFKTVGLTASCSVIPKIRKPGDGTSNLIAVPYTNVNTEVTVAAGTAITADGAYQITATGPENILDATVSSGTATIVWWIVEGGVGGGAGGGGGGTGGAVTLASGAVAAGAYSAGSIASGAAVAGAFADGAITTIGTEADNAVVNPALSATEIALLKGIITVLTAAPTAPTPIDGWVAAGSAASGENPVLIGGADSSGNVQNLPLLLTNLAATYASQQAVMVKALLSVRTGSTINTVSSVNDIGADGISGTQVPAFGAYVYDSVAGAWDRLQGPIGDNQGPTGTIMVVEGLYNGTANKFDRRRNNNDVTGLSSTARTATTSTPDQISYNYQGVIVGVNVSALTATGTLVITIEGKDPISSVYYTLFTGTAIAATGFFPYQFYPGAAITSGVSAAGRVPRVFRVTATPGNGVSITYSVNLSMLA